jgi:glutathione peroxidase
VKEALPMAWEQVARGLVLAGVCVGLACATSWAEAASPLTGSMKKIDGSEVDLAQYDGQVVLIVNVASRCGYTGQYAGLQELFAKYKDKGFVILGFPANDFGAQEPGSDQQIAEFCSSKYGVDFDMFSKITVKGADAPALYKRLTADSDPAGDVKWNFEKFLVGRDGTIIGRFRSGVSPDDSELVSAIEAALAKK